MKEIKQDNLFVAIESPGRAFQGDDDVSAPANSPYFSHCYKTKKDHIAPLDNFWAVSYAIVVHEVKKLLHSRRNYEQNTDSLQNGRKSLSAVQGVDI